MSFDCSFCLTAWYLYFYLLIPEPNITATSHIELYRSVHLFHTMVLSHEPFAYDKVLRIQTHLAIKVYV